MRILLTFFFFFKQKTAYEIDCDWSSDVCSSDLGNDERTVAMLRKPFGEFSGGGGFTGPLQADDHPDRRRARSENRLGVLAEHRGELVANDFDDLLVGRKLQHDFAADGFRADVGEQ